MPKSEPRPRTYTVRFREVEPNVAKVFACEYGWGMIGYISWDPGQSTKRPAHYLPNVPVADLKIEPKYGKWQKRREGRTT